MTTPLPPLPEWMRLAEPFASAAKEYAQQAAKASYQAGHAAARSEAEALLREAREKLHDWHTQSKEQFGGGGMCEYDFCRACGEPDYRPHQQGCEHVDRIARIDAFLTGGTT